MSDNSKIVELDLNDILPNRFQPRIKFNEESIIELSESIKEHGVLQPIIVRPIGDKYEIVTGERRYKASVLAGLKTIPTRILDVNDKDSAEIALIENVQRKDLTPIEEAISYKKILDMGYLTQEQLAAKLGRSQSTIANKIRLLNLCDEVQEALMEEKISERHARSLLRLEKSSTQRDMLKRIIGERLTVRKVDDEIKKILENSKEELDENEDTLDSSTSVDNNKSSKEDDTIDISDLFVNLEDDKIVVPKETAEIEEVINNDILNEEENGENDNMMNNMQDMNSSSTNTFGKFFNASQSDDSNINNKESNFVFNNDNNNQDMMVDKMNDLLAPQGSSPSLFNTSNMFSDLNQNNIFSVPKESPITESNGQSEMANSQTPNSSMFSNLMNNNQTDEYIDDNTFKDFLNPAYVDGTKKQEDPTNKSVIDSSVFAKFLDPEYDGTAQKTDLNNNIGNELPNQVPNMGFNQFNDSSVAFSGLNSVDAPQMQTSNSASLVVEKNESLNPIDNLENVTNPAQTLNSMLASEKKPDLLAPMGSNNSINQASDIFSQSSSPVPTVNPFSSQFFVPTSEQPLTPDNTVNSSIFNSNISDEPVIPEKTDVPPVSFEQPIFITASNQTTEPVMPNNPIIENPNMSKLLEVDNHESQANNVENISNSNNLTPEDSIPTTIAETANFNSGRQVVGSIENQPIIITDYNKQYDPVLPTDMVAKTPQIDFKQIINMIRELNDKIESYGYEIDTEEYDLADLYQVIIKITKK